MQLLVSRHSFACFPYYIAELLEVKIKVDMTVILMWKFFE